MRATTIGCVPLAFLMMAVIGCGSTADRSDKHAVHDADASGPALRADGDQGMAGAASIGSEADARVCESAAGSITDLDVEPSYSADYLHRWSVDGCLVRLDVIMTRTGGCGPTDLVMGTPLGVSTDDSTARIYVRGDLPERGGNAMGFDPAAMLPASATDTGFRQGALELWMVPDDEGFVYLRSSTDGHVEAWPLERAAFGCA